MTSPDKGDSGLPESPHVDSYLQFRKNLSKTIKKWLSLLLDEVKRKDLIDFDPRVEVEEIVQLKTSPVESKSFQIYKFSESKVVEIVNYSEKEFPALENEKYYKVRKKTFAEPLKFQLKLSDDDAWGEWDLGLFPRMTSRGTFIFRGFERCVVAQFTKSPGLFFSWEEKAETRLFGQGDIRKILVKYAIATVRPERGIHFEFHWEKEPGEKLPVPRVIFSNGRSAYLATFFDALGISAEEQSQIFNGTGILFKAITEKREESAREDKKDIAHIAQCIGLGKWMKDQQLGTLSGEGREKIRQKIQEVFFSILLGPLGRKQVNRRIKQINPDYAEDSEKMTKEDIAWILKAFLAFYNGKLFPGEDDPWDLGNLKVRLVGNCLEEGVTHWLKWMESKIRLRLNQEKEKSQQVGPQSLKEILQEANREIGEETRFSTLINEWLIKSPMSQMIPPEQNNLLEAVTLTRKVTFNGWGGIPTEQIENKRKPRDFHWSHYGRICPLDTPQEEIGISLSLPMGARVNHLGIIETACHKVKHDNGQISIDQEICWLSPWEEVGPEAKWITFPDQKIALIGLKPVQAHRGKETIKIISPEEVGFIHASEEGMYSLAANLIPYRKHNDTTRGVMACSFLKQALPLEDAKPPRVKTGYETMIPKRYPFPYGSLYKEEMAFGSELLVGYLPWKGWNFEDALVISRKASEVLSDVYEKTVWIKLRQSIETQKDSFSKFNLPKDTDKNRYDERGIINVGAEVSPEDQDPLVWEIIGQGGGRTRRASSKHLVPKDVKGVVTTKSIFGKIPAELLITISDFRQAEIGDKLANRHGHKGVISKIYDDCEMPYFLLPEQHPVAPGSGCGCNENRPHRHLELLINPLSVLGRMNIGQLYETTEARGEKLIGLPDKVDCYDPSTGTGEERKLGNKILVGEQYILKLDHNAADKLHARSREPEAYSGFVEQPLKGRKLKGGQRLGEMEVWALMAHNAAAIIKEFITLKSDNPRERKLLFQSILEKGIVDAKIKSRIPEAFKTFSACCLGLGISVTVWTKKGRTLNPILKSCSPDQIENIGLSLLDCDKFAIDIKEKISNGEVKTSDIFGSSFGYRYHPEGLESEQIFGPVIDYTCACKKYDRKEEAIGKNITCKACGTPLIPSYHRRHRTGHIVLARPVPNPFFLLNAGEELGSILGLTPPLLKSLLKDQPWLDFRKIPEKTEIKWRYAVTFFSLACEASPRFRNAVNEKLKKELVIEKPQTNESLGEENLAILKHLFSTLRKENLLTLDEFLDRIGSLEEFCGFLGRIIIENHISGIDLVAEMLMYQEKTRPLCLTILPVIPPKLRTDFKIRGSRMKPKKHDLKVLYQGVLTANAALSSVASHRDDGDMKKQEEYLDARRRLQLTVARLFCNEQLKGKEKARDQGLPGKPVRHSLSSHLEGKKGLIVGNLLGKRVDYSGRAVIVPDPTLDIDDCRIPLKLALKLFEPYLLFEMSRMPGIEPEKLIEKAVAGNKDAIDLLRPKLKEILSKHKILLNRQPTLHRLGFLGFNAELGEGSVISISPLVTSGYNADFDGDQMAIFLPLTQQAKDEVPNLFPSKHLWHPGDGRFTLSLTQDIALGGYLTLKKNKKELRVFFEEPAKKRNLLKEIQEFTKNAFEKTTKTGVTFGIKDLEDIANQLPLKGDRKKEIKTIVESTSNPFKDILLSGARGNWATMNALIGNIYKGGTISNLTRGLSIGEQLEQAFWGRRNLVDTKLSTAEGGALTKDLVAFSHNIWINEQDCRSNENRMPVSVNEEFWLIVEKLKKDDIKVLLEKELSSQNKGRITGAMWDNKGFGKLDDYEIAAFDLDKDLKRHPARIPPRLIGIRIKRKLGETIEDRRNLLYRRLYGRILSKEYNSFEKEHLIDKTSAETIANLIIKSEKPAFVRSPLTCAGPFLEKNHGICQSCYGLPLTLGGRLDPWTVKELAPLDARVGIIAAQAVGEPGTQMALRKKHLAGGEQRDEADVASGIENVKRCFQWNSPLVMEKDNVAVFRDTIDHIYRSHEITINPIHFEVLFVAMISLSIKRSEGGGGWIASAAHPDRYFREKNDTHHVLALGAINHTQDYLDGLKERVFVGSHLPEHTEEDQE